ncbi:MAG: hypothetical protein AAFV98_22470 [Chloroflexota bacterium]
MSDTKMYKVFHLKRGDDILAVLEACEPDEMFWLLCSFQPTDLFAEVASLFQQASDAGEDIDTFEVAYEKIRDMGVQLVSAVNNENYEFFVLHIEGDDVLVRYA